MFNNSDIGYLEGFTDSSSTNSTTTTSSKMPTNSNKDTTSTSTDTTTTTTPTLTDEQKEQLMATLQEKAKEKDTSTVTTSSVASGGAEGFNTFETERNIQKGKQSNSIPVSSYANQSDNVEAFGSFGGKFSDSFASF
jgi:hypothetical protein